MVSIGVVIIDQQAPTVVLPLAALPQVIPGVGPPLVWQHLGAHGLRQRRRAAPLRHGDCGGRLQCGGLGDAVPATLAWVNLHHDNDQTSYGVSVVDDFNVGLSVTPHEGRDNCPVLACRKKTSPRAVRRAVAALLDRQHPCVQERLRGLPHRRAMLPQHVQ
jgi:hypothetical protein